MQSIVATFNNLLTERMEQSTGVFECRQHDASYSSITLRRLLRVSFQRVSFHSVRVHDTPLIALSTSSVGTLTLLRPVCSTRSFSWTRPALGTSRTQTGAGSGRHRRRATSRSTSAGTRATSSPNRCQPSRRCQDLRSHTKQHPAPLFLPAPVQQQPFFGASPSFLMDSFSRLLGSHEPESMEHRDPAPQHTGFFHPSVSAKPFRHQEATTPRVAEGSVQTIRETVVTILNISHVAPPPPSMNHMAKANALDAPIVQLRQIGAHPPLERLESEATQARATHQAEKSLSVRL